MSTSTATESRTTAVVTLPAPRTEDHDAPAVSLRVPAAEQTLLAELRSSGLLFLLALVVTVGVAAASRAASTLLS